jgi:hypothetical protein
MKTNFCNEKIDEVHGRNFPNSNGVNNIETVVMARVRRIYLMRRLFNTTTLKVYGAVVLFGALASVVSVASVFANMPSFTAPKEVFTFSFRAVLNTEVLVQLLLVSFVMVVGLTVRDILKNSKENKFFFTRAQV